MPSSGGGGRPFPVPVYAPLSLGVEGPGVVVHIGTSLGLRHRLGHQQMDMGSPQHRERGVWVGVGVIPVTETTGSLKINMCDLF